MPLSRSKKITKLANAISEYRGKYNSKTGHWIRPPVPSARKRVITWLERLGRDPLEIATIDGFKSFPEYRAWMELIDVPHQEKITRDRFNEEIDIEKEVENLERKVIIPNLETY